MRASRGADALLGALAGVAAGFAVVLLLAGQGRIDWGHALRFDPPVIGWLASIAVSSIAGAFYGALYRFQPGRLAAAVGGGLLFGLLWWAVVWLTAVPLIAADGPRWTVGESATTFPLLIASVLTGGLTAILFHALGRWVVGERAVTLPVAASRVPITHRIVILGGGFGGVATAQRLEQLLSRRPGVAVTLVNESNFLLFTPMLAEVAAGSLAPGHVAAPLRAVCPRTTVRRAIIESVDLQSHSIRIRATPEGESEDIPYDQLVLAVGVVPAFHGLPGVAERSLTLKTLADAMDLRDHVIGRLDRAENERDPDARRRLLTFVVAGGGFAGAELIAALRDLVHDVLVYHPGIERPELRFVLVHSRDRILPELTESLAAFALAKLRRRGIECVLGVRVTGADSDRVWLSDGASIPTATFVWTAGNEPAPLLGLLPGTSDLRTVATDQTLRVAGLDDIWAVGDCARIPDPDRIGEACPPTAQHAVRQGRQAAENLIAAMDGRPLRPFRFRTLGMLVVLGHNTAVAEIRGLHFSGLLAWLMWRGIYLAKLPGFEKKVRVLLDWVLDLVFPRDIVVTRTDGSRDRIPRETGEAHG